MLKHEVKNFSSVVLSDCRCDICGRKSHLSRQDFQGLGFDAQELPEENYLVSGKSVQFYNKTLKIFDSRVLCYLCLEKL